MHRAIGGSAGAQARRRLSVRTPPEAGLGDLGMGAGGFQAQNLEDILGEMFGSVFGGMGGFGGASGARGRPGRGPQRRGEPRRDDAR